MRVIAISIGSSDDQAGKAAPEANQDHGTVSTVARQRHTARSARLMMPGGTGTPNASAFALP